jgi:hypothetical protein
MRKFMIHGLLCAGLASTIVSFYLYSIYKFVPEGSPDPLVSLDAAMRNELTFVKVAGVYVALSLIMSLFLGIIAKYLGRWGVLSMNAMVIALSIFGFYYVLSYQRDGWDMFQIIGAPLVFILPMVWLGLQPITMNNK